MPDKYIDDFLNELDNTTTKKKVSTFLLFQSNYLETLLTLK